MKTFETYLIRNAFHLVFISLMLLSGISSCNSNQQNQHQKEDYYTCPMDRQIRQQKPGNCPICKMELVEESSLELHHINVKMDDIIKATNESVLSEVKTILPIQSAFPVIIQAKGIIGYDTRNLNTISARIGGRIEKLYVKYINEKVIKGQKLLDLYSPELITAQENYLYIRKNTSSTTNLINESKQKLLLLGLNEDQIRQLETSNRTSAVYPIYSQINGYITNGNEIQNGSGGMIRELTLDNNAIPLKEGMYVKAGESLFKIADNSSVWATVKIFNSDIALIKKDLLVKLNANGRTIQGKINLIEPFYEEGLNALSLRIYLPNTENNFRVNEWIDASIVTDSVEGLWIPQTAVLDLGKDQIVFIRKDKTFNAHKVVTGTIYNHQVQVLSGLDLQTHIALNAQYLIDSESFIQMENP